MLDFLRLLFRRPKCTADDLNTTSLSSPSILFHENSLHPPPPLPTHTNNHNNISNYTTAAATLPNIIAQLLRRLRCAPELPKNSFPSCVRTQEKSNIDALHLRGAFPTFASSFITPSTTRAMIAVELNTLQTTDNDSRASIFAHTQKTVLGHAGSSDVEEITPHDEHNIHRGHTSPATSWVVCDTRRWNFLPDDAVILPLSSAAITTPNVNQLKKAKSAQMKVELQRKRELQLDEEKLLQEERLRVSLCSSHRCSIDKQESSVSGVVVDTTTIYQERMTCGDGDRSASFFSSQSSFSEIEDEGDVLVAEDIFGSENMLPLHRIYERRQKLSNSIQEEGREVIMAVGETNHNNNNVVVVPTYPKKVRQYSLQSKKYVERVVLAHRSQQIFALIWLLQESMQHAQQLHLKLAALYTNCVPLYLQALLDKCIDLNDPMITTLIENKYYTYFCSDTFDHDYYKYDFYQRWESLFLAVMHYLHLQGNMVEQREGTTTPPGSVAYAASLLYSMDLFERHGVLQVAVREVEQWIMCAWERLHLLSLCEASPRVEAVPIAREQTEEKGETKQEETKRDATLHSSPSLTSLSTTINSMEIEPTLQKEMMHLPMDWFEAQDAEVRACVSRTRRVQQLRHICFGNRSIRQAVQCGDVGLDTNDITTTTTAAENNRSAAAMKLPYLSDDFEGLSECLSEEEPSSHRVINVGCFGFSFFSRHE